MVPLPPFPHLACEQSLTTSALELKDARSTHLIDIITQEESHRRLRFDLHILEDDNDELRDLLSREEERSDSFERYVHSNLIRAEEAEARLQDLELDLRTREQELTTMRAEKEALQYTTVDLTAAVTEKLVMTRELSVLRPELEHLKTQAASAEILMAEKLALQRQISEVQCEVENAKREARRALAKRRNTGVEIAQEEQMDELRRQLKKAERARQRAEEAADVTQADLSIDEVRKELAREKRGRQKAEQALEEAQQNTQIEDVRRDLLREKKAKQKVEDALEALRGEVEKEKKAAARADRNAATDEQAEELRQALAKEKKARVSAERSVKQAAEEYGSQKAVLEDKLSQFRTKLRSSKTELKDKDAEIEALKAELAAAGETKAPAKKAAAATSKAPPAKNSKKRPAAQLEADATTLGTPGDGPAAKRSRKASTTTAGDKSTFSVTPFLNRTMSVAPEGSADDEEEKSEEETEASPKPTKKAAATKQQPLAVQSVNVPTKSKAPAQQRKPKAAPALAMVTEESEDIHSQGQENATTKSNKPVMGMKIKTKLSDGPEETEPGAAKKKKIRKSIHDFAAFTAAVDEDEKTVVKQKKRKLGGLGKTLFDEEEEMAPKALPGRGLFGVKGANFGGLKKGGMGSSSFLGAKSRLGSTFMTAGDGSGFVFSPLKRARKGLDDTLRG
ncbi:hypothetical protein LTR27_004241 [Elasticomyces elasticus]|nr:hypothetical protein LTR27_004241 [Elasticomyces elasticus]